MNFKTQRILGGTKCRLPQKLTILITTDEKQVYQVLGNRTNIAIYYYYLERIDPQIIK